MTVLLALSGVGIGVGLYLALAAALPARASLVDALAAPHRQPSPPRPKPTGISEATGRHAVSLLISLGLPSAKVGADLRVLERETARHLAQQAGLAVAGLVLFPLLALGLGVAGLRLPLLLVVAGTVVVAVGGFLLPDRLAATEAAKLRAELRYAVSAFLDLAATMLAAGAGLEQALTEAASAGTGPGHTRLRAALAAAHTTRAPVWNALHQLGQSTGVTELTELAASASLAGTEGAKIRATLAAKAAAVRNRLLSAAEAEAASATERMGLPTVILMTGFLIFTAYPAVSSVLNGLG